MLIGKKFNLASAIKKNYLGYLFIFVFCIAATTSISCSSVAKKALNLSQGIPFNYTGLRIETRSLHPQDLKAYEPLIACFGDSVTFGWNLEYGLSYPSQLEILLKEKYANVKVINCGIGGNTVIDAIKRIDKDLISYSPDIAIINFGLNDGMLHKNANASFPNDGLYYFDGKNIYIPKVGIDVFTEKYTEMLETLSSKKINAIVLGISPVTEAFNPENNIELSRKQKEIYYVYNKRVMDLSASAGLEFIDLWKIFNDYDEGILALIQEDGIHPGNKGLKLIAESVFQLFLQF